MIETTDRFKTELRTELGQPHHSSLTVFNAEVADSGNYKVVVRNEFGESEVLVSLVVTGRCMVARPAWSSMFFLSATGASVPHKWSTYYQTMPFLSPFPFLPISLHFLCFHSLSTSRLWSVRQFGVYIPIVQDNIEVLNPKP